MIWRERSVWVERFVWIRGGKDMRYKVEPCSVLYDSVPIKLEICSTRGITYDQKANICSKNISQTLKINANAAFDCSALDTSFNTRSHYLLTRTFCRFSHSHAQRHSHISIGSSVVRGCFDAVNVYARDLGFFFL